MIEPVVERRKKFRVWPEPKRGVKYGPSEFQKLAFIEKLDPRPHSHNLDVLLFVGAARSGKCLGIDTPIIMYDGTVKKVQDVEIGDLVMGPDSNPRTVLSLGRGREKMYRIIPENGSNFECNASHILSLKNEREEIINISVLKYLELKNKKDFKLWRPEKVTFPNGSEVHPVTSSEFIIESLEEDNYYGFTLDGDHLFLLGDFTVSHNTITAVARVIQYLLENPGAQAVVGAQNWPLLQRTAYDEWRKRFSIRSDWDHPLVEKKPTQQRKQLQLTNGSTVWFLHFSDFKILRGIEADIIHIEEASLLPSEDSMNELIRRLSGRKGPVKQLFLTTNPEEAHSWLHEKFSLEQDTPDYDGEPLPRGSKCKCHFCPNCLNFDKVEVLLDQTCEICGHERDTDCPGDQEFFRVVVSSSKQNKNLDSSYVQNMAGSMSEEYFKLYGEGILSELRQGKIYKGFTKNNKLSVPVQLDPDKPLYWSFDFNISYQCSVVCQETESPGGTILNVLDEIVLPEAGPEHIAVEFLNRYHTYKGTVYIYGDPAALNRKMGPNDSSQYQIIYNILTNPKLANLTYEPMKVEITVKANKKIPVIERVDATNLMLTDVDGAHKCFINPHCKYLFASLEGVRWIDTAGPTRMDINCDKNAARSPNKRAIHVLTHITDALGYLIYKRHPVIKTNKENLFFQIPGDKTVQISLDGVKEYTPYVEPPEKPQIKKVPASESFLDFIRKLNQEYDTEDFGDIGRFFG